MQNIYNMKAILEFNMDDLGDEELHRQAVLSPALCLALFQFDQQLRSMCKHTDNEEACKIRELLYEILSEHGVSHLL